MKARGRESPWTKLRSGCCPQCGLGMTMKRQYEQYTHNCKVLLTWSILLAREVASQGVSLRPRIPFKQ